MRLATDIDGVLAKYHEFFVQVTRVLRQDLNVDLSNPYCFGLDEEAYCELHNEMIELGHFKTLELTADARHLIDVIDPVTDEVWYITSREAYGGDADVDRFTRMIQQQTVLWLAQNEFPCSENLIFIEPTSKRAKCVELGLTVLIEDSFETATEKSSDKEGGLQILLIDRPWNQGGETPFGEHSYPHRFRILKEALDRQRW